MSKPYPWYYAVNDRPVKLVKLPDGSVDAFAFDWATGGFVTDRSYFAKTVDHGKDIDQLTEEKFDALVSALRAPIVAKLRTTPLAWELTDNAQVPMTTKVGDRVLTLRLNESGALYTLLVDGEAVDELDVWPRAWQMPSPL